jgi:hypothetical protein
MGTGYSVPSLYLPEYLLVRCRLNFVTGNDTDNLFGWVGDETFGVPSLLDVFESLKQQLAAHDDPQVGLP